MFRRRSSQGINPTMAGIMGVFQIVWVYYGLLIASRPVILWNLVAVIINFMTVWAYFRFARRELNKADKELRISYAEMTVTGWTRAPYSTLWIQGPGSGGVFYGTKSAATRASDPRPAEDTAGRGHRRDSLFGSAYYHSGPHPNFCASHLSRDTGVACGQVGNRGAGAEPGTVRRHRLFVVHRRGA